MNQTEQGRATHTPGPWEFDPCTRGDTPEMAGYIRQNGHRIAMVLHDRGTQFDGSEIVPERDRANGFVLAAAPLLLEALEAVEWLWEDDDEAEYRCGHCDASQADGHLESCLIARALRAARGEA